MGDSFIVTQRPVTERQGYQFSPYSQSRHDVCIQPINSFKCDVVKAVVLSSPVSEEESEKEEYSIKGEVTTSIVECKSDRIARDQTLAQLFCTLTESCVDTLKGGKLITRGIGYGVCVKYSTTEATVYIMIFDFESNKCFTYVQENNKTMPLHTAMNQLVTELAN